ncbi:MAG TPA: glutamate-cysteine ligase family protein [Candidatus Bathyarchaeia archaeon]|nr:glutamate-cysteine ligase family protein [Candidatus Bathyarchaeia archaeon]
MYEMLEVLGPEHEFSVIDEKLTPLPIVDKVIHDVHGRIVNCASLGACSFGKELQAHVAEFKANKPFGSPKVFEETMQSTVETILSLLEEKYKARLLGLGMHPFLRLSDARMWSHRDRGIYAALSRIFNLNQHGWLNIQSFQLNLPYNDKSEAVRLYNAVAGILPYLPAVAASSPVFESNIGSYLDNRLHFYMQNQLEVPSITGNLIPEYVNSFNEYERTTVQQYSKDLDRLNAPRCLLNKEWLNSRGAVIRHDRKAIEIRILDEQESVKSDVALSCFIRATLRGILDDLEHPHVNHDVLVSDFHQVMRDGLNAHVQHPKGRTAKQVCHYLLKIASKNATREEKEYLPLVSNRVEHGSLSNLILKRIAAKYQRTDLQQAIFAVYSELADCLEKNQAYVN